MKGVVGISGKKTERAETVGEAIAEIRHTFTVTGFGIVRPAAGENFAEGETITVEAIVASGGITSGVYTTDSSRQLEYLVTDSRTRFLFVENEEQLDKYLAVRENTPSVKKVIVFDPEGLHEFADDQVMMIDDLYALGRRHLAANPDLWDQWTLDICSEPGSRAGYRLQS